MTEPEQKMVRVWRCHDYGPRPCACDEPAAAPVGLSQAGYTDEAIGPNEARMIAMNERLVKERDELRAEVDRLSASVDPEDASDV